MAKRAKPKPQKRRNRERQVIDAAVKVFHRKGFSAASIQDVADEVGVLKGSLYYYIDSKEDLLYKIFMESHAQSSVILEETSALDVPGIDRIRLYFERYIAWYLENVERVSIYFGEWRHLTGHRRRAVLQQRRHFNEFVEQLVEDVKRDGGASPELNSKFATFFILGAVNDLPTWYARGGGATTDEIARVYTDMVVGTLRGTRTSYATTANENAARDGAGPVARGGTSGAS